MMKSLTLLIPLALACVEPPATDKGATVQPDGAAVPGAPEPGIEASAEAEIHSPKTPGPGAVVPDPGPGAPEGEPEEAMPQDQIEEGVSISGTLGCEGCEGSLIVRVEDAGIHPPQLLTSATFSAPGPFSMKAPRDKKVVLMVIHDSDGSGGPTPGEGIGLWTGGLLNTSTDTTDVELTVGVMPDTPPIEPEGDDKPEVTEPE